MTSWKFFSLKLYLKKTISRKFFNLPTSTRRQRINPRWRYRHSKQCTFTLQIAVDSRGKMKSPLVHTVKMIKNGTEVVASPSLRHLFLSRIRPWPVVSFQFRGRVRANSGCICARACERELFLFLRRIIWYQRERAPRGCSPHTAPVVEQIIINFGREALPGDTQTSSGRRQRRFFRFLVSLFLVARFTSFSLSFLSYSIQDWFYPVIGWTRVWYRKRLIDILLHGLIEDRRNCVAISNWILIVSPHNLFSIYFSHFRARYLHIKYNFLRNILHMLFQNLANF